MSCYIKPLKEPLEAFQKKSPSADFINNLFKIYKSVMLFTLNKVYLGVVTFNHYSIKPVG